MDRRRYVLILRNVIRVACLAVLRQRVLSTKYKESINIYYYYCPQFKLLIWCERNYFMLFQRELFRKFSFIFSFSSLLVIILNYNMLLTGFAKKNHHK